MNGRNRPLGRIEKVKLAVRIWALFLDIQIRLRRYPLPEVADQLSKPASSGRAPIDPRRLGIIVYRVLRLGSFRARCLLTSLTLLKLMADQGNRAQLVIGMPAQPSTVDAHGWIEFQGREVGPPPGKGSHVEMARYPIRKADPDGT